MDKTSEIFKLSAPYNNPYQGPSPRVLFVCSAGLLRSATAANHFAKRGWNTRSCGSEYFALIPISANLIHWAQKIYFVNKMNMESAKLKFVEDADISRLLAEKATALDIPDQYAYGDPELVSLLEEAIPDERL
jgi:predicted protein tyrosine phosphatase